MRRNVRGVIALLALAVASCKGADGATGPQGPQGPQGATGPQGLPGPSGTANMVNLTGVVAGTAVDLALPASATAANMPTFTCYIASAATGPWIVVPFSTASGAPICGVVIRADGIVEIRLRNWISGYYYYVVAAWK